MPRKQTVEREREGKAPTTQAGEFVREEIEHVREGKHGARSTKQAIAIGLSKARRAGVKLPTPRKGQTSERTRRSAERDVRTGRWGGRRKPSARRSRATMRALKREGRAAASKKALSRQAKQSARPAALDGQLEAMRSMRSGGGTGVGVTIDAWSSAYSSR